MVITSGAGSGEEVSGDYVNYIRSQPNYVLERLQKQGLSDQRLAFIGSELRDRQAGTQTPLKDVLKTFSEPRNIVPIPTDSIPIASAVGGGTIFQDRLGKQVIVDIKPSVALQEMRKQKNISAQTAMSPITTTSTSPKQFGGIDVTGIPKQTGILNKAQQDLSQMRRTGNPLKKFLSGLALSGVSTASFVSSLVKNPKETIQNLPVGLRQSWNRLTSGEIAQIIRNEPQFTTGAITGEILTGKGITKGIEMGTSLGGRTLARISPGYRAVEVTSKEGRVIRNVPLGTKTITLELVEPGDFRSLPLSEQAKFAGKKGLDVATAQRDLFGTLLKREITIDKPRLPGQPELERSFFISTPGRSGRPQLRISRLGLKAQQEARILDMLSGDITFKKQKPQAILFESIDVERIPPSLQPLLKRAINGDTQAVFDFEKAFLKYQLKPSGKAKPIGFAGTREPEFTLAPGEIIRRVKKQATTIIDGKVIPIIQARIINASKNTKELIDKLNKNKITPEELSTLRRRLNQESGLDYSPPIKTKRYLPPSSILSRLSRGLMRTKNGSKKYIPSLLRRYSPDVTRRAVTLKSYSISTPPKRTSYPTRTYTPKKIFRTTYGGLTRPTPKTPPRRINPPFTPPPRTPRYSLSLSQKFKKKPITQQGYFALYKQRGKYSKISKKPLTRQEALDIGAEVTDRSLANTFKIIKTNKKPQTSDITIKRGYFQRTQNKFRPYRIRKGQRLRLINTFIEKRGKPRIDTISEKQKLQASALIARLKKKVFGRTMIQRAKRLKAYSNRREV